MGYGAATKLSLEFSFRRKSIYNSKALACNVATCASHLDTLELSIVDSTDFWLFSTFTFLKVKLLLFLTEPPYEIGACLMTA